MGSNKTKFWYMIFLVICLLFMLFGERVPDDDVYQQVYEKSLEQSERAEYEEDAD